MECRAAFIYSRYFSLPGDSNHADTQHLFFAGGRTLQQDNHSLRRAGATACYFTSPWLVCAAGKLEAPLVRGGLRGLPWNLSSWGGG